MKNGEIVEQCMNVCGKKYKISDYYDIKFCKKLLVRLTNKSCDDNNYHSTFNFEIVDNDMKGLSLILESNYRSTRYGNGNIILNRYNIGELLVFHSVLITKKQKEDTSYNIEWLQIGNQELLKKIKHL